MRLGLIGRGPWANVYAKTLRGMGVDFWQAGRDWWNKPADAYIVASSPESHVAVAGELLWRRVPVLIEKPLCLRADAARALRTIAKETDAIAFTGHTRLYSDAWREFKTKALAQGVRRVRAVAGGPCKLPPLWDWGAHLVAMCLDLGFDPLAATIVTSRDEHPLTFIVNGEMAYIDHPSERPTPLEVLLAEFMAAIERGEPDIRGLELGVKVVETLETMELQREAA